MVKRPIKRLLPLLFSLLFSFAAHAQKHKLTDSDKLRGKLDYQRSAYDVQSYNLTVAFNIEKKLISGHNIFYIKATKPTDTVKFDLSDSMSISYIEWQGTKKVVFYRYLNTVYFMPGQRLEPGKEYSFKVNFYGQPLEAKSPPWEGGFVWGFDPQNKSPWISVACQGDGASLWWPCKDHLSDEPKDMVMKFVVPDSLEVISNGKLVAQEETYKSLANFHSFIWRVAYPINIYNVTFYIGKYAHLEDKYWSATLKKDLDLDYYVRKGNEEKAEKHFQQVKPMLKAFEELYGPYPFFKDGYALVEAPYWGMEHQSAIAYGNHFENNEFGFDFIIVHESGHEWWGNAVSVKDHGELWIHEAFCTYSEALYLEKTQGPEQMLAWLKHQKGLIKNEEPMLGPLEVNYHYWPDADMYYRGTWMLHSLRNMVDDDAKWFALLKAFYEKHKMGFVDTEQTIAFFEEKTGFALKEWFGFYLKTTKVPDLKMHLSQRNGEIVLKGNFHNTHKGFQMPVQVTDGQHSKTLLFGHHHNEFVLPGSWDIASLDIAPDKYYITSTIHR